MATEEEIYAVMAYLADMYPYHAEKIGERAYERQLTHYVEQLAHFDARVLSAAAKQHVAGSAFYPAVSELVSAADTLTNLARRSVGDEPPDAAAAWQQCAKVIINDYAPDSAKLARLHPLVAKAIEAFGLTRFYNRMIDDEPTNFAQFRDIYNAYLKRSETEARMLPMSNAVIAQLAEAMSVSKQTALPAPDDSPRRQDAALDELRERGYERINNPRKPAFSGEMLTRQQIERREGITRLQKRERELQEALANESDAHKRRMIEIMLVGVRRTLEREVQA
jgi:hypothetical protein